MGYGYSESVEEVDLILIIQLSMSNFDLKRTKADMTTRVLVSGTKVFVYSVCWGCRVPSFSLVSDSGLVCQSYF